MARQAWMLRLVMMLGLTPLTAAGASYTLDPAHTYPSLEFSHMGISIWRGKFNRTTGTVTFDPATRSGTVSVTVDAASIDFGHEQMNEVALGADWLDVANAPTMTYRGALTFEGDQPVAIDGALTLRGVTQPLRLEVESFKCIDSPFLKKEVCGADATGEVNRADFGMVKFTEFDGGRVHLRIQVEGVRDE